MKAFTDRLYDALDKHLYQINLNHLSECEKLKQKIRGCKKALTILKRFVGNYFFGDCNEEIDFFKKIKPRFYSQFIYYLSIYKFEIKKPIGCQQIVFDYIDEELSKLKCFFDQNQSFCCYWRTGDTHLDHLYFTRCALDTYADLDDFQGDEQFSTSHDYRLSKLLAFERYQKFLFQQKSSMQSGGVLDSGPEIIWTGNQTELVELIYALAECGSLNNGNIEIKAAIDFFQGIFKTDLKHYYHKFRDITNRKKERTVFLDKLKLSLDRKIESKFV